MEKPQAHIQLKNIAQNDMQKLNQGNNIKTNTNKRAIWDCGSSLYDSFELNSFQKQLDSAIISSSRTFSMPRLPSETHRSGPLQAPPPANKKKPGGGVAKFSRSFQKLLKSVFRAQRRPAVSEPNYDSSPDPWFMDLDLQAQSLDKEDNNGGRYFVAYEKPNGLSTIPEVPENVAFSPEISSLVRKTMSDRFRRASFGIHCG